MLDTPVLDITPVVSWGVRGRRSDPEERSPRSPACPCLTVGVCSLSLQEEPTPPHAIPSLQEG